MYLSRHHKSARGSSHSSSAQCLTQMSLAFFAIVLLCASTTYYLVLKTDFTNVRMVLSKNYSLHFEMLRTRVPNKSFIVFNGVTQITSNQRDGFHMARAADVVTTKAANNFQVTFPSIRTTRNPANAKTSRKKVSACTTMSQATSQGQWAKEGKRFVWKPRTCELPEVKTPMMDYKLKRMLLLGDSNTYKFFRRLLMGSMPCKGGTRNFKKSRCLFRTYLKVKDAKHRHWPPRQGLEGPVHFGKIHRGCTDCSGCKPTWLTCRKKPVSTSLEYMPVEFARDVTVQSAKFETTQENVVDYLKKTGPPTVIVFNTGMHDLAYGNITAYKANLRWYAEMLITNFPNAKILFINTPSVDESKVPPKYKNVTRNDVLSLYNSEASIIMESLNISYLDNFHVSNNTFVLEHYRTSDPVHLEPAYYYTLIDLLHVQLEWWFGTM